MLILGVDPGGRATGLVLRDGDRFAGGGLLVRERGEQLAAYVDSVADAVAQAEADLVAVEAVKPPNPHVRVTNVSGVLDTAAVFGAVCAVVPAARLVVVQPGGHGSGPLTAYPAELVGHREREGHGKRRHLRSAWDLAGAAAGMVRSAR